MKRTFWTLAVLAALVAGASAQAISVPGQLLTSCNAVITTGNCTPFALPLATYDLPSSFTWQVVFDTGTASAVTVNLMGSIDGTNYFQYDTTTAVTGEMRWMVDKPAKFIRCAVAVYTKGTTNNLTCQIMATAN